MSKKWVFGFEEGDGKNKHLLGGKGANLCEMTQIGLKVPPGFVITTDACLSYLDHADRHLPEGYATIGHSLDLSHEAPTCLGMTVTVKVTLVEIDGMKLRFEILVWDDLGEISRGHHERIVVNKDEFVQKTRERLQYMVERNL